MKRLLRPLIGEIKKINVRNRFLIFGTFGLAIFVFFFVLFEVRESGRELNNTLRNESHTLIESLSRLIEYSIATNNEIENLLVTRLNAVAALVDDLDNMTTDPKLLGKISRDFEMSLIAVLDSNGRILQSNQADGIGSYMDDDLYEEMSPVINGSEAWLELGYRNDPVTQTQMYLLARQRKAGNGCIITGFRDDKLLDFRKKIGIGKQIQDLGNNRDIVYIVLQDEDGIFTASRGVKELSSFSEDTFLVKSMSLSKPSTRKASYNNGEVFEVVKPVVLEDGTRLLNRIGLSMDNIRSIQQRSMTRVILIGIGIFITGFFLLGFILTRERFAVLKEENKRIQTYTGLVMENMADGVITVSGDLIITIFNRAALNIFKLSDDNPEGRQYPELFPNDELNLAKTKNSGFAPAYSETTYETADGSKILGLSTSIIYKQNGGIDSIVLIIRDLTELKHTQRQLERREKLSAMGELAGGVAHEIRNPLNAINIIAQRFEYEFQPEEDREEYLKLVKTVRTEVSRVNRIIRQFLDFARPAKLSQQMMPVTEVMDETISLIESQAREKNIRIIRDYVNPNEAFIDKEKIKQVLINILQNSIEAIGSDGSITCTVSNKHGKINIEISDTGSGIPPEIQTKIFNLYFTTKPAGTGLGLSIVHQIVTEHGGEISVESKESTGTTMKISLPVTGQKDLLPDAVEMLP